MEEGREPLMAKKPRPSFDAPKKPTEKAGWVYRSGDEVVSHQSPVASHQSPVVSHESPVVSPELSGLSARRHPADRLLMPFALFMMTMLAPVSWLRGKR